MINLDYSKIETYLDNVSLTKQSRIEYTKECRDIIDVIKMTVMLGYKTVGNIGSALKSIKLTKFKKSTLEYSSSIYTNELKTFLMHLGYSKNDASCILRILKAPLSIKGHEIISKLKTFEGGF